MENYKKLNSELIAQVQELKSSVAAYQKELVYMRSLLFEEHKRRLEQEQKIISILACNFRDTIKQLKPEADMFKLFNEDKEHAINVNSESGQSSERRTSVIIEEFRSSAVVQHRRRSLTESISPIKRHSTGRRVVVDAVEDVPNGSQAAEFANEERNWPSNTNVSVDMEVEESSDSACCNEMDEGHTEEQRTMPAAQEKQCDGKDNSLDKSIMAMSLECIRETDEENITPQSIGGSVRSIAPDKRQSTQLQNESLLNATTVLSNITNHSSTLGFLEDTMSPKETQYVVTRRGKYRNNKEKNKEVQECMHSGQLLTPRSKSTNKDNSINTNSHNDIYGNESPILNLNETITCDSHIASVPSSTPYNLVTRHYDEPLHRESSDATCTIESTVGTVTANTTTGAASIVTSTTAVRQSSSETETENSTLRPRRRCTPTNLVEPSLRLKIRNETVLKRRSKRK